MTTLPAPRRPMSGYSDRRSAAMLVLGFSAGLPYSLVFSTLSFWLLEAGIEQKTITMFSWAALGYSFKFIWAPLADSLPLPWLGARLGQRRSWLLAAQLAVAGAVLLMAASDPSDPKTLYVMAAGSVLLGFSAATQDIVIDAYRIEAAPDNPAMQSVLSSVYTAGYRIGMLVSGAGSLYLAVWFGTDKGHYLYGAWRSTYQIMAALMGIGVLATLLIREPQAAAQRGGGRADAVENLRLLTVFVLSAALFAAAFALLGGLLPKSASPLVSLLREAFRLAVALAVAGSGAFAAVRAGLVPQDTVRRTWIEPLADFFRRYGKRALLLLALIGLYRTSDIVAGTISNVFYANSGFGKEQIATAVKLFGVAMTLGGGLLGGLLAQRFSLAKMMMLGAAASAATNLLFVVLARHAGSVPLLYLAVSIDNLAAGLAQTVLVAFLSSLTNIRFTAVQYALFSSLMTLLPKTLGGYFGAIADQIGYESFFTFTALLGLPVLLLVHLCGTILAQGQPENRQNG